MAPPLPRRARGELGPRGPCALPDRHPPRTSAARGRCPPPGPGRRCSVRCPLPTPVRPRPARDRLTAKPHRRGDTNFGGLRRRRWTTRQAARGPVAPSTCAPRPPVGARAPPPTPVRPTRQEHGGTGRQALGDCVSLALAVCWLASLLRRRVKLQLLYHPSGSLTRKLKLHGNGPENTTRPVDYAQVHESKLSGCLYIMSSLRTVHHHHTPQSLQISAVRGWLHRYPPTPWWRPPRPSPRTEWLARTPRRRPSLRQCPPAQSHRRPSSTSRRVRAKLARAESSARHRGGCLAACWARRLRGAARRTVSRQPRRRSRLRQRQRLRFQQRRLQRQQHPRLQRLPVKVPTERAAGGEDAAAADVVEDAREVAARPRLRARRDVQGSVHHPFEPSTRIRSVRLPLDPSL